MADAAFALGITIAGGVIGAGFLEVGFRIVPHPSFWLAASVIGIIITV